MKVGDLIRYKWHGHGPRPTGIGKADQTGIVISTDGVMLCSFALEPGQEPYEMGTVEVLWPSEQIERETYADLEVINESR